MPERPQDRLLVLGHEIPPHEQDHEVAIAPQLPQAEVEPAARGTDHRRPGGFLLGVGYGWTQGVKTLGDGIVADQALPDGETEIRYKTRSAESIFVFVSRRFDLGPVKD